MYSPNLFCSSDDEWRDAEHDLIGASSAERAIERDAERDLIGAKWNKRSTDRAIRIWKTSCGFYHLSCACLNALKRYCLSNRPPQLAIFGLKVTLEAQLQKNSQGEVMSTDKLYVWTKRNLFIFLFLFDVSITDHISHWTTFPFQPTYWFRPRWTQAEVWNSYWEEVWNSCWETRLFQRLVFGQQRSCKIRMNETAESFY